MPTTTRTLSAGDRAYLIGSNPLTEEVDPRWFVAVEIAAIGTWDNGTQYADYIARGYGARAALDQFVPKAAVKRVTVNGRRSLVWR